MGVKFGQSGSLDWTEFLPSLKSWMRVSKDKEKEFLKGELLPREEAGAEEEKEALKKLSKEQRVELLRMFNRCKTVLPQNQPKPRVGPNGDAFFYF